MRLHTVLGAAALTIVFPAPAPAADTFAALRSRPIQALATRYPSQRADAAAAAPASLTASDGTGLALETLEARIAVRGPLAYTELHLAFVNPEDRVREGRFQITLPTGAAISRLAMKLPAGWQEAEVVERQAARQVYEDFLHRKQDPALLERQAGNRFRARVFPIPARATKEIKIAYSQVLTAGYRLPLKGLPRIRALRITAFVGGRSRPRSVVRERYLPDRDFELPAPAGGDAGLRHGRLALVRISPRIVDRRAAVRSLAVLVDSSASRAAGYRRQVEKVGALLRRLRSVHGGQLQLHLACFDQTVGTIYEGSLEGLADRHLQLMLARRPLGASDLGRALRWAGGLRGIERLLLVTDGVATAGKLRTGAIQRTGLRRVDVVLVGGIRDEPAMRRLVRGTLEQDGVVLDGELPAEALAARLGLRTVSGVTVSVRGASWSWPQRLDGLQAGDQVVVYARLHRAAVGTLGLTLGGPLRQRHEVRLGEAGRPQLERAVVQARIAHLQGLPDRPGVRQQIVALSTRHRVLSDHTALLVLETERDYARYGIQRRALNEILVVGQDGAVVPMRRQGWVLHRQAAPARRSVAPPPPWRAPATSNRRRTGSGADRDGDGLVDTVDSCPFEPETHNGYQDDDGCPDRGRVVVHHGRIEILDKVYFETGKAVIRPVSHPILAAIAATLQGNPQIQRIRIEGHSDARGAASYNLRLTRARARTVQRYLVAKGVAPARLRAVGYGEHRPLDGRQTREAWSKNRRVEFVIERRVDGGGSKPPGAPPPRAVTGRLAEVQQLIRRRRFQQAIVHALRWRAEGPGDLLALVALGEALQAAGHRALAARAFGSVIDLYPSRADMRRFAGGRLENLRGAGLQLAIDTYARAVQQRPDHVSGHRLLAWALVRAGRHDEGLAALEAGLDRSYRISRPQAPRVLREELGLVAAALAARARGRRAELARRIARHGASIATRPSLRFVLSWETDANDVDLHVRDGSGERASYRRPALRSGGALYADVTNGYGPECFAIARARRFPYRLAVHYYARGPMGYGMGAVQVVRHDGRGRLAVEGRPFVVMNDGAFVELGLVRRAGRGRVGRGGE